MKDYMAQFKVAILEVYHLDNSLAMLVLKWGLPPSRLTYSLDKIPAKSYLEVLADAKKYIHADKGALSRCEARGKLSHKKV